MESHTVSEKEARSPGEADAGRAPSGYLSPCESTREPPAAENLGDKKVPACGHTPSPFTSTGAAAAGLDVQRHADTHTAVQEAPKTTSWTDLSFSNRAEDRADAAAQLDHARAGDALPPGGTARPSTVRALFDNVCRRLGDRGGLSRLGLGSVTAAAAWLLPTQRRGSTSACIGDDLELGPGGPPGARSAISLVQPSGRQLSATRDMLPGADPHTSLSVDQRFLRACGGRHADGGGSGGAPDSMPLSATAGPYGQQQHNGHGVVPGAAAGKGRYGGTPVPPSLRMVLGAAQASEAMASASSPAAMGVPTGICSINMRRGSVGYAPGPDSADSCSSASSIPVARDGSTDTWAHSSSNTSHDTLAAPRACASAGPREVSSRGFPLGSAPCTPPRPPPSPSLPPPPTTLGAGAGAGMPPVPMSPPLPGLFKPRAMPGDGLLYLAPAARASMWSAARGARWSLSQYDVGRKMYTGYASSVHKAVCRTSGTEVVLKLYQLSSLSDFLRHQVLRELEIHSRLRCPSTVQLLAAFREGDTLALVLEYVRGGSLQGVRRKLGGRMNEQWAVQLVVLPLLRAVAYLHRQGIVHRDIKPENLLFTPDWRLKLCDFGVSIALHEERAVTRAGSREYMAPEVSACPLKNLPHDNKAEEGYSYGYAADIFSIGAVVYELMTGFPPFPCGPPPLQRQPAAQLQAQPRDVPHEGAKENGSKAQHGTAQGAAEDAGSDGLRGLGVAAVAAEGLAAAGRKSDGCDAEASLRLAPHPHELPQERHKEEEAQGTADATAASCAAEKEQPEEPSDASRVPVTPLRGSSLANVKGASLSTAIAVMPGAGKPPPLSRGSSSAASPPLAFPSSVSPAARSFIRACLEPHPGDRASIDQLMVHEWVVNAQQACRSGPLSQAVPAVAEGEPHEPITQ